MWKYYIAENLKIKHLFVGELSLYGSIIAASLIFLLSEGYLFIHLFNWWYTLILPLLISFSCALLSRIDGKMNDAAVKSIPINCKKVWIAKLLVGWKYLIISCLVLLISYFLFYSTLLGKDYVMVYIPEALLAIMILLITFAWQIPLYLWIGYKMNIFFTIMSSFFFNIILEISFATSSYWFLCPFSYASRLLCPVLKIMPNGLELKSQSLAYSPELESYSVVPIGTLLSIVFLVISIWATAEWYQSKEVK